MDKVSIIKTETETLLKKMVAKFDLNVEEDAESHIFFITVKTEEEASVVIGRHGETIRALQKILEVILYKQIGEPTHILLNVNDYREKQKERLHEIASELAEKTKAIGRPSHYRGLSSFERKMVHEYVTKSYADLTTYSVGEGRDRHLVIDLKSNEVPSGAQKEE